MRDEDLLAELKKDKDASVKFKERRFTQWNENYHLYRDKVQTNRLTQRQPVNIPIMRETIGTWISKIDEAPLLTYESRTRDNRSFDGEIILNELWNYFFDLRKLDLLDNLDKKIVGLQGRSFKKMGWSHKDNFPFIDIIDPYDIEVSPLVNPLDLETAANITQTHIYRRLRDVLANPKYLDTGKHDLKQFLDTKHGLLKAAEVANEVEMRNERLRALGAHNFDEFHASDMLVELNESYKLIWDAKESRFVRYLVVTAMDKAILFKKPLKDAIGISSLPIISWADDPDLNDLWCDGKGDSVRTINKVVNTYFSQDLENRAYRNFGMYFFDSMSGTFSPKAFDPQPFGMYGVPGKPEDVVKQMDIQPLSDTTASIQFLKDMVQSSVAQTPTERGEQEKGDVTLGEVQLSLRQSQGRNEVTAKNYRRAWKECGHLFYELLNANSHGQITLYKKGNDGEYRSKTVFPTDWKNPKGYECKVVYKAEKEAEDQFALQKAGFVDQSFNDNPVAMMINKRKKLELLGWNPDEIDQVMQAEEQKLNAAAEVEPETGAPIDAKAGVGEPTLSPLQPDNLQEA